MQQASDDLDIMLQFLRDGKVILCPTDTIWGLSADALNEQAVAKVFKVKDRDPAKKLIVLVDSIDRLKRYISSIHPRIETLLHFCDRPLTVVYGASKNLPHYLHSDDGTVAIRVTKSPLLQDLIKALGAPIVSTSANIQGRPEPKGFHDIDEEVKKRVDYISHAGRKNRSKARPSVIIRYNEEGELIFLR